MFETTQVATLLPARIADFAAFEHLRSSAYESHAAYESFVNEVLYAEEEASAADAVDPDRCVAIGVGLSLIGRGDQAQSWFDKAPDNEVTHYLRAQHLRSIHKFDQAIDRFNQAARASRLIEPLCRLEIVETYLDANRLNDAKELLEEPDPGTPHRPFRMYLKGLMFSKEGLYPEAIETLRDAVELDPLYHKAQFKLAYLLDLFGEDAEAIRMYQNCTATPPVHVNALINLAVLYKDRGQLDEAGDCLRTVLDTDPNHERAKLFLKDVRSSRSMLYDEDQERMLESRNALLDIPISEFELSVRSRNCLKRMSIDTLGDLLRTTEADLLAYKNFGETSLNEIKNMLAQKGLRLGQMAQEEAPAQANTGSIPAPDSGYTPPGSAAVLGKSVSEVELSVRSRKCLQRLGILTLGDLASRTEAELLGSKNFGVTSLNEIKQRLAEHGLSLRRLDD
jgi:DNA-directed RNA polymerase subunit alpha